MRIVAILAVCIGFLSCTSVNHLDRYELSGHKLAMSLATPPAPEIDVNFSLNLESDNPIGTVLNIGSNLVKAAEAAKAKEVLERALRGSEIPETVYTETVAGCLKALDMDMTSNQRDADFLLDLVIQDYGIKANNSGKVYLRISLEARLYHLKSRTLVWERHESENESLNSSLFGFDSSVANVATAGVLGSLTEAQLRAGFEKLALKIGGSMVQKLQRDIYESRRY